jgi:predicted DNA-binding protein (MmcQ/YjbR family)
VALEAVDTLPAPEIRRLLRQAYDLVLSKLPKKTAAALANEKPRARTKTRKTRA